MASLKEIDLDCNKIGDVGVLLICQTLIERKNTGLYRLDLSQNLIQDQGAKYLAKALEINRSLSTIILSSILIAIELFLVEQF